MTARTRAPKRLSAREQLIDMAASENWTELTRFRRLLRAHERELAELAQDAIDYALAQAECPSNCPCRASVAALRWPIRDAILGPQRTKGGRR